MTEEIITVMLLFALVLLRAFVTMKAPDHILLEDLIGLEPPNLILNDMTIEDPMIEIEYPMTIEKENIEQRMIGHQEDTQTLELPILMTICEVLVET